MKTPSRKSQSQTHLVAKAIANKERRKLYARQTKPYGSVLLGLGFAGLVGWSITAPTLLAITLGIWIDFRFPSPFSWTLALMLAGLTIGCLIAWEWVSKEQKRMAKSQPPDDFPQSPADSPNQEEGE
ncbi:AtpZ/AtpI family protein [Anabaena cylindrica UHCC 0172]|uniref:AtpZ/AtpI family protein n=1 Tax=Anabaena cylindrica TaxID=1165 RepID=UPI002B20AE9B|nr:AtpZ/AtpI family protein [Anabaena cylindrica]MEA5549600.1 AtpZ/AtpI family protein [Anabaena cylindrica UHCC 0172]